MDALRRASPLVRASSIVRDARATTTTATTATTVALERVERVHVRIDVDDDDDDDAASSSIDVDIDRAAYVGGAVWAMDWCPPASGDDDDDGGARAACRAVDARAEAHRAHATRDAGRCRGDGVVQIWRSSDDALELEGVIVHDGGCVNDVKWSPYRDVGGIARAGAEDAGALAASRGDGIVDVWIVPRRAATPAGNGGAPCVLAVRCAFRGKIPRELGAVLCLEWNAVAPGRLAAGTSAGAVVVWDISTIACAARDEQPAYPTFVHDLGGGGPVRAIAWRPCEDEESAYCRSLSEHQCACASDFTAQPIVIDLRYHSAYAERTRGQYIVPALAWVCARDYVVGFDMGDRSTTTSSGEAQKATTAKTPVHQFCHECNQCQQPTISYVDVPGRSAVWCLDVRRSQRSGSSSSMVACATANGVVCVKPARHLPARMRKPKAHPFEVCAGLKAYDEETGKTLDRNPIEPPKCFDFVSSRRNVVRLGDELYPSEGYAKPGSSDAPTTAQHCVRWRRGPENSGWWLASAGDAGFLRVQRFNQASALAALDSHDRQNWAHGA